MHRYRHLTENKESISILAIASAKVLIDIDLELDASSIVDERCLAIVANNTRQSIDQFIVDHCANGFRTDIESMSVENNQRIRMTIRVDNVDVQMTRFCASSFVQQFSITPSSVRFLR